MKIRILITVAILLVASPQIARSQNPTYLLKAINFIRAVPNEMTFEIRMEHTNAPTYFEYAGGQYFFEFNKAIANGGTLTYTFAQDTSDLPLNMRPRNPTVYTSSTPGQLRLAVNTFPGAGNGFVGMSTTSPGTRIIKMRLRTTAVQFASVSLNLEWKPPLTPYTKVFAYIGTSGADITNSNWHSIDSSTLSPSLTIIKCSIEGLLHNGNHRKSDTVLIQFRNVAFPYSVMYSSYQALDSSTLSATFSLSVPPANYYIVVRNKNSLETWSKPGGEPLGYGTNFYDFTIAASQAYGGNLVLRNGLYCIYTGNVNGDDIIDAEDMLIVDNAVFNFADGSSIANLNGDGIVDIEDMAIIDRNAREFRIVERPGASESQLAKRKILIE
jgi:hypothetical protein